jgi:hypothetical protein
MPAPVAQRKPRLHSFADCCADPRLGILHTFVCIQELGMRSIAFVGNCQMRGLAAIYQNYAGDRRGEKAHYLRTEGAAQPESLARLAEADLVVGQLMDMGSSLAAVASAVRDKRVVQVPHAAGAFLWPQAGEPHPTATGVQAARFGTDYGDRYLNRAIRTRADPAETVRDYVTPEFGARMQLARRFEITMARQEERDRETGYDIAGIVRRHFRDEYLFRSQGHPQLRIMRHLALTFFQSVEAGADAVDCLLANLKESNFPREPDFAPIHPAVIDHFGLGFVHSESRFALWDECETFPDHAYRYLGLGFNQAIEAGLAAYHRGELAAAEERLLDGLSRSPRSARAHAALADIGKRLDRLPNAIAHMLEAIRLEPTSANYHHRLYDLYFLDKQFDQSLAAIAKAAELDPGSAFFFHGLSDMLLHQHRLPDAIAAREQAAFLAPLWPHHHRRLSDLLRHAGDAERADAALRKAISLEAVAADP